ncbi:MAG TPA: ankyrin repeat domain-containing protein [Anaerohalosphaeraceae bacterium]|nr:ankyrin repeat domain-containing protein [Anaerohalosphaeraceae bacterium]
MKNRVAVLNLTICFLFFLGCQNDKEQLEKAVQKNDWETVKSLLKKNPQLIKTSVRNGYNLLYAAIVCNNQEMVRYLLEKGADVNEKAGKFSEAPLHWASTWGRQEIALLLIQHGADVNIRCGSLYTPLHNACLYSHEAMVRLLLEHGAQVNALDFVGRSPLWLVCDNRRETASDFTIIRMLLDHGADLNFCLNGCSIFEATLGSRCFRKAEFLADCGAVLELPGEHETCRLEGEQLKDYIKWYERVMEDIPEQLPEHYSK